ncbi:pyrimidine/purine nucleoside phosphorylase [Candidatus Bipolaricaulota bacterium]|nr:pyrimidine/purine nucleoside phosphorylase [Candidatus Bipolaricaulota bacterium]
MLKVNEYFDGKVKSIGFEDSEGPVTSGVMEAGNYTFSTSSKELMIVVTGSLTIKRPQDAEWETFPAGESFNVPANVSFDVKVEQPTAYICRYS